MPEWDYTFTNKIRSWQGDRKPLLSPVLSLSMPAMLFLLVPVDLQSLKSAQTQALFSVQTPKPDQALE